MAEKNGSRRAAVVKAMMAWVPDVIRTWVQATLWEAVEGK